MSVNRDRVAPTWYPRGKILVRCHKATPMRYAATRALLQGTFARQRTYNIPKQLLQRKCQSCKPLATAAQRPARSRYAPRGSLHDFSAFLLPTPLSRTQLPHTAATSPHRTAAMGRTPPALDGCLARCLVGRVSRTGGARVRQRQRAAAKCRH